MPSERGLPILQFRDRSAWEQWLDANHSSSHGVWLKFAKKSSRSTTVRHPEALEEALRYGWIDGQAASYDEHFWLTRFTPRTARSKWSQVNREKAQTLIAHGRMKPAGLAQVEAAQQDGRWDDAYEPQSRATVPKDLRLELDRNPSAKEFFDTLTGARRYAFLYRLHHTKKPEARARRIADYIALLNEGKTLNG
jgi:uncharacterized protein YdeI (YjbR/CyaY-like superfamily)